MSDDQLPTVIVVEDDSMVREGFRDCLESAGYSVVSFGSAEEFLAAMPLSDTSCLIIDIQLPGLSGLEFQRRLNEMGNHPPIVFVTAHGTAANRQQALREGAAAFLTKPVRRGHLLNAVTAAMRS